MFRSCFFVVWATLLFMDFDRFWFIHYSTQILQEKCVTSYMYA